jgi:hypothetical protein
VEQAFLRQVVEKALPVARERLLVTADWALATAPCWLSWRLQVPFVLRLPANITVCLDQQWQKLGSLRMGHTTRRRALGRLWCLRSNPQRCWGAGAGTQQKGPLGILALGQQSPAVGAHNGAGVRAPLWL